MTRRLPTVAVLLGLAGLIPFLGAGLTAVAAGSDLQASRGLAALTAYGAVILAFLGGVHWGFVLAPPAAGEPQTLSRREPLRLVLGICPALIGWAALIAPAALPADVGLAILIAGFLATVIVEGRLKARGFVPAGYMWLRWGLSLVVLLVLITVLGLRLLGARIVL